MKKTLRQEIRDIVDASDERLPASTIYGLCPSRPNRNVFAVTLNYMVADKQIAKRKANKSQRSMGVRFAYGPGKNPVSIERYGVDRGKRIMGFMEEKRSREARARAKKAA